MQAEAFLCRDTADELQHHGAEGLGVVSCPHVFHAIGRHAHFKGRNGKAHNGAKLGDTPCQASGFGGLAVGGGAGNDHLGWPKVGAAPRRLVFQGQRVERFCDELRRQAASDDQHVLGLVAHYDPRSQTPGR